MKPLFTLIVLSFASIYLAGQTKFHQKFGMADSMACPFDSTTMILGFPGWEAYQTLDGKWDGEKDSSRCIDVGIAGQEGVIISFNEIDPNKPVFFSYKPDSINQILLAENGVFEFQTLLMFDSIFNLEIGNSCQDDVCSGALVRIQIPDSSGLGYNYREHWIPLKQSVGLYRYITSCLPTEKFKNGNYLHEMVLKFTFKDSIPNSSAKIKSVDLKDFSSFTTFLSVSSAFANIKYVNNEYEISMLSYEYPNFLIPYFDTTYPSPDHISYYDIEPPGNSSKQETLNIIVHNPFTLNTQPYAQLRGAQVLGDTIRHIVNLVVDGADVCMFPFAEFMFEGGNNFIYKSGDVGFNGPRSCFMFGKGSALKVAYGSTFHYGSGGSGILMLKTGSTIEIGNGAELVIHNRMMLREYDDAPGQVYMALNEGSKLTFAPGSRLSNTFSFDGSMKLNVYMNGGLLDDSGLPAADRQLINRIYPENSRVTLEVFPNPMSSEITLKLPVSSEETAEYRIYTINGQRLYQQQIEISNEYDSAVLSNLPLNPGIYIIEVKLGGKLMKTKIVKM